MDFKKIKAFTLAESLLALLILVVVCLLFQTGISQLKYVQRHSFSTNHDAFQIFLLQMSYEMKDLEFVSINSKQLLFKNEFKAKCYFEKYENLIRKKLNNGHQPLLMNVKDWNLVGDNKSCHITVTFLNNEMYEGVVTY